MEISPTPTDEEAAVIAAAMSALWPRPVAPADEAVTRSPWRFSGRWWSVPLPVRRDRPWR